MTCMAWIPSTSHLCLVLLSPSFINSTGSFLPFSTRFSPLLFSFSSSSLFIRSCHSPFRRILRVPVWLTSCPLVDTLVLCSPPALERSLFFVHKSLQGTRDTTFAVSVIVPVWLGTSQHPLDPQVCAVIICSWVSLHFL